MAPGHSIALHHRVTNDLLCVNDRPSWVFFFNFIIGLKATFINWRSTKIIRDGVLKQVSFFKNLGWMAICRHKIKKYSSSNTYRDDLVYRIKYKRRCLCGRKCLVDFRGQRSG